MIMTTVSPLNSFDNTQHQISAVPAYAIHVICHHDGLRYVGLTEIDLARGEYLSEAWAITNGDPADLLGGWLYFHDSSNSRSTFAGHILEVIPHVSDTRRQLVAFRVRREPSVGSVAWRGVKASRKVHNGGLVLASRPHELNPHFPA